MFSENKKIVQIGGIIFLTLISLAVGLIFIWQRSETNSPVEVELTVTVTPTPLNEIADIPTPTMLTDPTRTVEITQDSLTQYGLPDAEKYTLSEPVRVAEILPNGKVLGFTNRDEVLSIIDIDEGAIQPFIGDISPKLLTPLESDYIFIAVQVPRDQQYPVWGIHVNGETPILLGTTTGVGPLYSSTIDGKVLLVEDGHLVLKWLDGNAVQSKSLELIEEELDLNWDQIDLRQSSDSVPITDLSISPNGQWLALFDSSQAKLWIVSIDSEFVQEVPFPLGGEPWITFLDWSSDERWLGYSVKSRNVPASSYYDTLQIVEVGSNKEPVTLISSPLLGIGMAWSPNGDLLAYTATERHSVHPSGSSVEQLFLADGSGRNRRKLSDFYRGDGIKSLYWNRDNGTLSYKCLSPETGEPGICVTNIQ